MWDCLSDEEKIEFNRYTMIGALAKYISTENEKFQPMNANFGIIKSSTVWDRGRGYGMAAGFLHGTLDLAGCIC